MPLKGYRHSEETRKKMSESHKGVPLSKEHKKNMLKSAKAAYERPEIKTKILRIQRELHSRPEYKTKMKEVMKRRIIPFEQKWLLTENGRNTRFPKGDKHPCWEGGKSFLPYDPDFNIDTKRAVLQRDKYTCQQCGAIEHLHVHHIDHNKQNSQLTNLVTLCLSCHMKHHNVFRKAII